MHVRNGSTQWFTKYQRWYIKLYSNVGRVARGPSALSLRLEARAHNRRSTKPGKAEAEAGRGLTVTDTGHTLG